MEEQLLANAPFLHGVFDSIPAMLFIIDDDVKILHLNATASNGLGLDIRHVYKKRGGEAFHCVHSTEVPEGCGHAPTCKKCVIRNAAAHAVNGEGIYRKTYVLLTLENVSDLIHLKSLLPICMHCKRIRDDEGYWNDVASYFASHLDVEFSHGLCKECLEKFYPEADSVR